MTAYTVAREGDGFRFNVSEITKGATNNWLLPMVALSVIPMAILAPFTFGLSVIAYVIGLRWALKHLKEKAARGPTYGEPVRSFAVDASGFRLENGRVIPRSRINSIDIKNEYGGGSISSPVAHVVEAGSAASIAVAMGSARATALALRSYYVSVQYGGTEERVAEKLDELGATGLQADIIRALQGQPID